MNSDDIKTTFIGLAVLIGIASFIFALFAPIFAFWGKDGIFVALIIILAAPIVIIICHEVGSEYQIRRR